MPAKMHYSTRLYRDFLLVVSENNIYEFQPKVAMPWVGWCGRDAHGVDVGERSGSSLKSLLGLVPAGLFCGILVYPLAKAARHAFGQEDG